MWRFATMLFHVCGGNESYASKSLQFQKSRKAILYDSPVVVLAAIDVYAFSLRTVDVEVRHDNSVHHLNGPVR